MTMPTVTFLNLPLTVRKAFIDYPYFVNLSMLQNTAVVKAAGHAVCVLDSFAQEKSNVSLSKDSFYFGCTQDEYFASLEKLPMDVVVITNNPFLNTSYNILYLKKIIRKIKEKNQQSTIILADCYIGGMHYIDYVPEKIFNLYPEINYIVKYHSEKILPELISNLCKGENTQQNIFFGKSNSITLDRLPFPAWEEISIENYFRFLKKVSIAFDKEPLFKITSKVLPIFTSRGCVFSCIFCSSNPDERGEKKKSYLIHSLQYMKKYIEFIQDSYGVDQIIILDELVNLNQSHFEKFIDIMNKHRLRYDFPNGLRADKITKEILLKMKGRIETLSISAESGNSYVLKQIIKKKLNLSSIEKVADWCKDLSIPLLIHYLIGLPDENKEQINDTLFHALHINQSFNAKISMQYATPIPGTKFYDICKEKELLSQNNTDNEHNGVTTSCIGNWSKDKKTLENFMRNFKLRINAKETKKIILNLTYKCNNHCMFCATGNREKKHANLKVVKEKLSTAYVRGIRFLDIDGGEPTLHKDLFKVIRYAKVLGYKSINITTNGRLLSYPEFARKILKSGINSLLISLHGYTSDIHCKNTRTPESFTQTIAGIQNILREKPPNLEFGVNTTITKFNYNFLTDFLGFVKKLGVKKVNIQFVTPFGRATKDILPDANEAASSLKEAIREFGKKLTLNIANLPPCYLNGYDYYALGDFKKTERNMIFLSRKEVNLFHYLSQKRTKSEKCKCCLYSIVCEGFYEFN